MGVRLNILANPAFRLRLDAFGPTDGGAAPATRVVAPGRDAGLALRVTDGAAAPGRSPAAGTAIGAAALPANPVTFALAEEDAPAVEPVKPQGIDAATDRADELDAAPAQRLRNFRFRTAAESVRERELEERLDRLERELETTADRLRFSDSFAIRIDARLDRARLKHDLDQVHSEIGRLRLIRLFGGVIEAGAPGGAPTPPQDSPAEMQPIPPDRAPGLNLLA